MEKNQIGTRAITPAQFHQNPYVVRYVNSTDTFKPYLYYIVRYFKDGTSDAIGEVDSKSSVLWSSIHELMVIENLELIRLAFEAYAGGIELSDDELQSLFGKDTSCGSQEQVYPVDLTKPIEFGHLTKMVEHYVHEFGAKLDDLEAVPKKSNDLYRDHATNYVRPFIEVRGDDLVLPQLEHSILKNKYGVLFYLMHGATERMDRVLVLKPLRADFTVELSE